MTLDLFFVAIVLLGALLALIGLIYGFWQARKGLATGEWQWKSGCSTDTSNDSSNSFHEEIDKETWDPFYSDYPGNLYYRDHHHHDE